MGNYLGIWVASLANVFLAPFLFVLAAMPVLLYVVARWRTQRENHPDPQLGLKVALSFFRVLAYQIVLFGLYLLVWALMSDLDESTQEQLVRTGAGLLVPAVLILLAHVSACGHTNQDERPIVSRLFGGLNLLLTGVVGFAVLMAALFLIFQKGVDREILHAVWAAVIVYDLAWAAQAFLLSRSLKASTVGTLTP